jgi:hypothetical protein
MAEQLRIGGPRDLTAAAALPSRHCILDEAEQALTLEPKSHLHPQAPTSYSFRDNTGNGATMSNVVQPHLWTFGAARG